MLYTSVISVVWFSVVVPTGQTKDAVSSAKVGSSLMMYYVQRVDKLNDQVKELQARTSAQCTGGGNSIKNLTADLEKLKSEVRKQHAATKRKEPSVYFRAYLSHDKRFGAGTTVVFDKIDYNVGGGYNPTSGIFTAPVSGLYEFKCQLENKENGQTAYTINHEGSHKAILTLPRPWETNFMSTIFRVAAGQHIWIYGHWDNGQKPLTRKGMWSQFTGYLLRK